MSIHVLCPWCLKWDLVEPHWLVDMRTICVWCHGVYDLKPDMKTVKCEAETAEMRQKVGQGNE